MPQTDDVNPYRSMVMDALGPEFNHDNDGSDDVSFRNEPPNPEAARFYALLANTDEPLWEGCKKHTKLSALTQLLNCKVEFNMSERCYDRVVSIVKNMLPDGEKFAPNFYKSKKKLAKLGLGYQKIDVCINSCMLYYKENADKMSCYVCGHPRYKPTTRHIERQKALPYKVLRYLPLTPRLQRLFMSEKT